MISTTQNGVQSTPTAHGDAPELEDPIIRTRGVKKRLGRKSILNGVDLDIARGETRVLIGQSGEGKSVLLKHLCGLFRPDEGEVYVLGTEISKLSERESFPVRSRVGMLFQGAALFDSLNVEENVGFPLYEHSKLSVREIREIVVRNLEMVKLRGILDRMPSELSGGMRKRVGLARVITQEPDIILYDEPTTGLDPVTSDAINDLIVELSNRLQVTSVVVTHDMVSAFKVGDTVSMLLKGRILRTASVEETKNTDHPVVRQFIEGLAQGPLTDGDGTIEEGAA